MTDGLIQLGTVLNSIDQPTSPFYFKNIEGFYYGWIDPEPYYQRFDRSADEFDFVMNTPKELLKLVEELKIPQYGDMNYDKQVIKTTQGAIVDPVDLYI